MRRHLSFGSGRTGETLAVLDDVVQCQKGGHDGKGLAHTSVPGVCCEAVAVDRTGNVGRCDVVEAAGTIPAVDMIPGDARAGLVHDPVVGRVAAPGRPAVDVPWDVG